MSIEDDFLRNALDFYSKPLTPGGLELSVVNPDKLHPIAKWLNQHREGLYSVDQPELVARWHIKKSGIDMSLNARVNKDHIALSIMGTF